MLRVRRLALGALLLVAVGAYANAWAGVFLFDDRAVILDDARLASPAAFVAHVAQTIRPFTKLTFLVDRQLYGDRPAGYHLLNLLLHLACGVLAYNVVRLLGASHGTAFWTAALFLLHPLATEAVTYISGRPTGLMTCCYLAAFLLFLRARGPERSACNWTVTACAAVSCLALSLLAKETAVVFPALLALHEIVVPPREAVAAGVDADRARRSRTLTLHLALGGTVVVFLAAAALHARYAYLFRYGFGLRGFGENLVTQVTAVAYALSLFAWPARLNFDHDIPVATSLVQPEPLAALFVLALLLGTAVVAARRLPLFTFGILWFFIHLLPTNSVLPRYDVLSERNLYLPSLGIYLAAVVAAAAMCRRVAAWWNARHQATRRGSAWATGAMQALAALLVLTLAGATVARNRIYSDPVLFWSDAVRKSAAKARPHTNLGQAWFEAGQVDRALDEFRAALALDPFDPVAQRNLLEAWRHKAGPHLRTNGQTPHN
jgi:tetratricopeptide (TPR) repeat protein